MKTSTGTRHGRRIAAIAATAGVACAAFLPASAARASASGYTPSSNEWWLGKWSVPQDVWPDTQGSGVTVAVVDSGVQADEADLKGVVRPGADMLGDGGSGQKDYEKPDGHGTAVAVLIAGQGGGTGTVGIAPHAKILPVHVIDPSNGPVPIANGIKYAVDHGASVINISVGGPGTSATTCDPTEQNAVSYALARNAVVVAAAGDTSKGGPGPTFPAACSGVLAVGAVEQDGSLWPNSTQQPYVSVAAPGDHMVYVGADGRFTTVGAGTSFSAPLVSGAAALIRAKYPAMPWYTVVQRLTNTAVPVGQVPNDGTDYGIINVNKAVHADQDPVNPSAPNPVYARYLTWLKTPDGQQFAKANGISASQAGNGTGAQTPPAKSSGGSGTLIIVAVIVVVLIVAGVVIAVVVSRNKSRRGPGAPSGSGGYGPPGTGYGPPPGQYPQQGQPLQPQQPQYPQHGQYPPPGGYPAPGQYPPQDQYRPPR